MDVIVAAILLFGLYAFITWAGFQTRWFTGKSGRTAENMYDSYADSPRQQRRYAREHGGHWQDEDEPGR